MGSLLTFFLLLAILGLTTATVNIKGTPENVVVNWTPNKNQTFKRIEVFLNGLLIIQEPKESSFQPKDYASCQVDKQMCTIINATVAETDKYKAIVTWTNDATKSEETETVDANDAETKSFVCVMGPATKPEIKKLDNGSLVCTSKGFPAPSLTWKDAFNTKNDVTGRDTPAVWNTTDKRSLASSTYNAPNNQYISVICTAKQHITDNCKHEDTVKHTNFQKLSKPIITNKKTKDFLICESKGVPAPQLSWVNVSNVKQNLTTVNGESSWNYTSIKFNATKITMMDIKCFAKQVIENGNYNSTSDKMESNSAGKIGGPSVLVAALVAVAFFTRS